MDLCYEDNQNTDPEPPAAPKSNNVNNAREIIVHEEHNPNYAFVNVDVRNDHFGEPSDGGFPHLTVWPIIGAVAATLLLVFIVKKIRDCIHKCKTKKETKKLAEQAARNDGLEANLMTPLKFHTNRFEEINEKNDQLQLQKVVKAPSDKWD